MPLSREQFDEVMAAHESRLRAQVLGQVGAGQGLDHDELVQEVRIRVWRVLSSEKTVEHLASYLRRTVVSVVIDALRRLKSRREEPLEVTEHEHLAETLVPEQETDRHQRIALVRAAFAALPERRRLPAQLLLQGFNPQEIGKMLGLTDATARNLAYRGVDELKAGLRAAGVEDWDD
jgi:RNA polymerase sigma-70 factor (ECF subfamily)